jgi:hypothetical protein
MSPKPIRAKDTRTIPIEIDHRRSPAEGVSVLRAAELNGIFVPSLLPQGSHTLRRMPTLVEITGMRGYRSHAAPSFRKG